MINNSTNINKINNHISPLTSHLSPQTIENKTDHNILRWNSRSWHVTGSKNVIELNLLMGPQ